MLFTLENNRTQLHGADQFILNVLDQELRYPTQIALAKEAGIEIPEMGDNNWDGWVRMLRVPRKSVPWIPTGLVSQAQRICNKMGYLISLEDKREKPESDIPETTVKIPLRDYQEEAVRLGVLEGRGVFDLPPRAGKTRGACELHRQLALPTIWIAPTDRIVQQTNKVIDGFFGKNYATHLIGSANEKEASKYKVVLCTAATAVNLSREFYQTREMIIVDEFHRGAAVSYRKIFDNCEHIYYRYGMTGTYFRSGEDAMAMHALLSKTIYKITSAELLQMGYLVPTHTVFLDVPCTHLRGLPSTAFQTGHGKYGIYEHKIRNQLVAHAALLLHRVGRTVLILVGTKKQGRLIRDILKAFLPTAPSRAEFNTVEFISTDVDRKVQTRILESFELGAEVKILIGTSLLGEGVDLPNADALVYARGEHAEVTLTQNVYRTCTAIEGKKNAIVVDFADRHHRKLLMHAKDRLKVFFEEPTFSTTVLQDSREFTDWLSAVP